MFCCDVALVYLSFTNAVPEVLAMDERLVLCWFWAETICYWERVDRTVEVDLPTAP